jgi:hypothetical protein
MGLDLKYVDGQTISLDLEDEKKKDRRNKPDNNAKKS